MESKDIEFLYHYTNVSTLDRILRNQNIKFSPLTVLDDSEEEKVQDKQQYGKYCFVSSWTEEEEESIPMWNIYTNLSEGVRIKLPKNPFQEYFLDADTLLKYTGQKDFTATGAGFNIIIPPDEFLNRS